jgi:hypothetical protein
MMFPFLRDQAVVADGGAIRQGERGDFTASCGISTPAREAKRVRKPTEAAAADTARFQSAEDELWLDESPPPKKAEMCGVAVAAVTGAEG